MTTDTAFSATTQTNALPGWRSVLVVVAHPDDESFALGAVVDAFTRNGSRVSVLCLTHGEASTLHGVPGSLSAIRSQELSAAARALGVSQTTLLHHPDGALSELPRHDVASEVIDSVADVRAEGLLVFDPTGVTGHLDHAAASAAALSAADVLGLPVLGWTLPTAVADQLNDEFATGFLGHALDDMDIVLEVDRQRQLRASTEHVSQALATSVLSRRLELLGANEHLRWLREPRAGVSSGRTVTRLTTETDDADHSAVRVVHRGGDRFDIAVGCHVLAVDQPLSLGGGDTAPSPTDLFVASLASSVAFSARGYLVRHGLPADGLVVESEYTVGERPARVAEVKICVRVPDGVPVARRDELLAVVGQCTVHSTLETPPRIAITVES